jgi:hypothetical protein
VRVAHSFLFCSVLLLVGLCSTLPAEENKDITKAPPEAVAKWRQLKFGMFIHWGPVSLKGTTIGWSRGTDVPIEEYDNLYKRFNPVQFNGDQWAKIAKDAGMKYMVLVTKHHDGFCMFDTKQTDYNIMHSPFKRDVVKKLSEAARKEGIAFGTYYSVPDWHNPDFSFGGPMGKTPNPHANMDRYDLISVQSDGGVDWQLRPAVDDLVRRRRSEQYELGPQARRAGGQVHSLAPTRHPHQ